MTRGTCRPLRKFFAMRQRSSSEWCAANRIAAFASCWKVESCSSWQSCLCRDKCAFSGNQTHVSERVKFSAPLLRVLSGEALRESLLREGLAEPSMPFEVEPFDSHWRRCVKSFLCVLNEGQFNLRVCPCVHSQHTVGNSADMKGAFT
jgi:hypothetical protein